MVTVSGLPGSGTTTACALLQQGLGWEHVNAGAIFRQLAAEAGLDVVAFGLRAEADPSTDRTLDQRMVALARARGQVILEGRLTGWMALRHGLPALRCWLAAPVDVRAERVSRRDGQPLAEAVEQMRQREESERRRYLAFHAIDYADLSIYDLVLDTAECSPQAVADQVLRRLREETP